MKPRFELNRTLDRIAAALLLVFVLLILFLPIAVTRYFQAQPVETQVNPELHAEIEHLQDTTEELQETIDELQAQADDVEVSENLEILDQTLDEMSEQIEQIDSMVAPPSDAPLVNGEGADPVAGETLDESLTIQDELLTLIGWTVGILSILTAVILAVVVILRGKRRRHPSAIMRDMW